MYRSSASRIKQVIDFDCPICSQPYDEEEHYPMLICSNQHSCCLQCLDRCLFAKEETTECFMCKGRVRREQVVKFRLLNHIRVTIERLPKQSRIERPPEEGLKIGEKKELLDALMQEKAKNTWLLNQLIKEEKTSRRFLEMIKNEDKGMTSVGQESDIFKRELEQKRRQVVDLERQNQALTELNEHKDRVNKELSQRVKELQRQLQARENKPGAKGVLFERKGMNRSLR